MERQSKVACLAGLGAGGSAQRGGHSNLDLVTASPEDFPCCRAPAHGGPCESVMAGEAVRRAAPIL